MSDNALLNLLWDTYKDTTFSQNALPRDLSLSREDEQAIIHQLHTLKDQPPQNGLKIKSVASGIFKVIHSAQNEGNSPKGLPLTDQNEAVTGEMLEPISPESPLIERFSFFASGNNSAVAISTGNIHQLQDKLSTSPAWKMKIEEVRQLTGDAQSKAKDALPAFTPSIEITHADNKRSGIRDGEFRHTSLIQADFDDHPDPNVLIEQLKADPHCRLIFRSVRAKAKALVRVAPVRTLTDHAAAFEAIRAYCRSKGYGEIDTRPKNIASICYISHDPAACLKDAEPLPWVPLPSTNARQHPTNNYDGEPTEITDWLSKHNIAILGQRTAPCQNRGFTTMYLVACPWEQEHTQSFGEKDTAVFVDPTDEKWSFNCFHAHCKGRGWKDFRAKVAPQDRYEKPTVTHRYLPSKRTGYLGSKKGRYLS